MVELSPGVDPLDLRSGFAGDTYNTAWYLRRIRPDWTVRYVTSVGQDALSETMLGQMRAAGIDTDHIRQLPDRTVGLYLITVRDGERSFSYWRDQSAARMLAADQGQLDRALTGADVIYLSGITLAIIGAAGRAVLQQSLKVAHDRGALVVFDPNLRPRLWQDTRTMCDAITDMAALCDIVLPSFEDEATFFGDADPAATLARYQRGLTRTVIVKNGPDAVIYDHCGQTGSVAPTPIAETVDTTSAGDSFNAGAMAALLSGADPEVAIRLGSEIAAQVVCNRGALVPVSVPEIDLPRPG
ncbi:2-dehydro-3-deoxygluconokinase (plasmid) [Pseudooceanicola algae]|uniref:2-dehydro-3-deoxygluconokinase n=2 Tax=Pseudooceanicola algae TaxID=1537215 RepID=A0A418SCS6_9RHOB|nr:2-dehydro-3-deoxygluconokinase [Pseudooceanicola algae]